MSGVAFACYTDALLGAHDSVDLFSALSRSGVRSVRRWAATSGQALGVWTSDDLVRMLTRNSDQLVRRRAADWLASDATPIQLRDLLDARYVDGVLLALTRLADLDLPEQVLMPLLGHRSARVRETAQWRARRRGLDIAGWYRAHLLVSTNGPAAVTAGLAGLADTGEANDLPLVESFLTHTSPVVRAAAITTAAAFGTLEQLRLTVGPMLLDPSPRVAAAAARALTRVGASEADAAAAWGSEQPWSRRAAWRVSRTTGSWSKVAADLRASTDSDLVLAGLGLAGLRNWLWADAATTWSRPTPGVAALLEAGLEHTELTYDERRRLAFHAGLTPPRRPTPLPAMESEPKGRPKLRLIPWRRREL